MKPEKIRLQLLPWIYPGASEDTWRRRANAGQLGPLSVKPGMVKCRMADTVEVERRYGEITEQQYADAVAVHKRVVP